MTSHRRSPGPIELRIDRQGWHLLPQLSQATLTERFNEPSQRRIQRVNVLAPAGMVLATAALIVGFFLLREHWGPVLGYWPYLLLLACPLMHLMHGNGHGGHSNHSPGSGWTHNGSK